MRRLVRVGYLSSPSCMMRIRARVRTVRAVRRESVRRKNSGGGGAMCCRCECVTRRTDTDTDTDSRKGGVEGVGRKSGLSFVDIPAPISTIIDTKPSRLGGKRSC
jgi:hypothetical protein